MSYTLGYVARFDPANFEEGQPVRTSDAYRIEQSLAHLINQSPQTYLNWAAKPDGDLSGSLITAVFNGSVLFSRSFPTRWWRPDRPSNFLLRVRARTSTVVATVTLGAKLLLDNGTSTPAIIDSTQTVASASSSIVISSFTSFAPRPDLAPAWRDFTVVEDSARHKVQMPMFRLDLSLTADDDEVEESMEITGVFLQGFT